MRKGNTKKSNNIKPLNLDQEVLTWLCVLPAEKSTSKWRKRTYIAFVLAAILCVLTVTLSSLMYALKFMSIDLQKSLIGLESVFAAIQMANSIVVLFLIHHKIPIIYGNLTEIYEKRMNHLFIKNV